jgi:hypothetical protein
MRKKLNKDEKKVKIKLKINENLNILLNDYLQEIEMKKSKLIEKLVSEYLKNKKV